MQCDGYDRGVEEGYEDGYAQGHDAGFDEGHSTGYDSAAKHYSSCDALARSLRQAGIHIETPVTAVYDSDVEAIVWTQDGWTYLQKGKVRG